MPNRTKISTKTTRNKEFNSYETNIGSAEAPVILMNTVTTTTANTKNGIQNIKLLDVNEAIVKKGSVIAEDAFKNTTLLEMTLGVNQSTANKLYDWVDNPPEEGTKEYNTYMNCKILLAQNGIDYSTIKNWKVNYTANTVMNTDANIKFNPDNVDTDYYIFGAPDQVVLNNRQHYNNCGIESTLNTLAMAGIIKMNENLKDQDKVQNAFLKSVWERNLAGDNSEIGVLNQADGGTRPDDYRDIMEYYGISSKSYYITTKSDELVYKKADINKLAYKISQGYGAIIGVSSDILWKNSGSESGGKDIRIDHAVAITGVVYQEANPTETSNPVGFYIHDSGGWMTKFISYDEFIDATLCDYLYADKTDMTNKKLSTLKEYDSKVGTITKDEAGIFVTLTDESIKVDTFNLNVTGDKYANILWGNNSNNVIKGMNGNDKLYGRAGRDTIRGGNGNDIIVGNEALNITAKYCVGDDTVDFTYNTVEDFETYLTKAGINLTDDKYKELSDRLDSIVPKQLALVNSEDTLHGAFDDIADLYEAVIKNVPSGINDIYGDAGSDIIIGGEQADLIYGGAGNDYIYGGDGKNAVYGGSGNDVVIGGFDNDRLFGDAGNDTIFGLGDDDIINGGAGNDFIYGGEGSDMIETGSGNDTVYFEGANHGQDEIMAKSGNTIFKFIDDETPNSAYKASDMFFSLVSDEENEKVQHLGIKYKQGEIDDDASQIEFENFFTLKSGKTKALYIDDGDIYNVTVSKKANATVANTKMTGTTKIGGIVINDSSKIKNSKINNILITTYDEGTTITTSDKNDIVTMAGTNNELDLNYDSTDVVDTITYTKGIDKYVSEERNTNYIVNFNSDTTLSIYDNVEGLIKWRSEDAYNQYQEDIKTKSIDYINSHMYTDYKYNNAVSKNDQLRMNGISNTSNLHFLFDVAKTGEETLTDGLFILDSTDKYVSVAKYDDVTGYVYMDSFFVDNLNSDSTDIFGNGQIEKLYYKASTEAENYTEYENFSTDIAAIKANVATWLSTYNTAHSEAQFDCAFDALKNVTGGDLSALIAAYSNTTPPNA